MRCGATARRGGAQRSPTPPTSASSRPTARSTNTPTTSGACRSDADGKGDSFRAARALRDGVCARRRARRAPHGAHRQPGEARRVLRRQDADHRLRAVQRAQLGHPAHRGRDAIQGAQPHPPPAARLELPAADAQRELRHPARLAARDREPVVHGHRRRGVPEHRHHRRLRAGVHRRAGGRPRVQDGLRAHARAARQRGRRRHRRAASRWPPPMREASA